MELEDQLKTIATNTGPCIKFWRRALGCRDYETLFLNRFYESRLVLVKYIIDEPSDFFSSNSNSPDFPGGTLAKYRRGQISLQGINQDNFVCYWTIVNYTDRDMNIHSKNMDIEAETYVEDIAKSCRTPAVFDSPKRGFKERTFYFCMPVEEGIRSLKLCEQDVSKPGFLAKLNI